MALGLRSGSCNKKNKNLSLLKKNSKPRVAIKTGQKRPKKSDFEVNPAADSIFCSTPQKKKQNTVPLDFIH